MREKEAIDMTDEELISYLEDFPLRRLHVLARGRVHRHFRMGKQRLIEVFLKLPPTIRSALEEEVRAATSPSKVSPTVAKRPASKRKPTRRGKRRLRASAKIIC